MILDFDKWQGKFKNKRCFIIGSAPSINEEKLWLLKDEVIITVNLSFKAETLGLPKSSFYVLTDLRVYDENQQEILKKSVEPRFYNSNISNNEHYNNGPQEDYIPIQKSDLTKFDIDKGVMPNQFKAGWGKVRTVVLDAAIMAFFMGFSEIYLLGADFNFQVGKNTHFYGNNVNYNPEIKKIFKISRTVDFLNNFFIKHGIKMINLSKNYKNNLKFHTNRLENIL